MTFVVITTLPKTTHNTSTLNTGETSSNYSIKLSLSPHKSSHGTFLDSLTVDLFKILDVKPAVEKETYSNHLPHNFLLSLWPGQKSAWISILLNRFQPCEAKDLLLPTTKLAISNLSVSSPGSVFHLCSPQWDGMPEDIGRSRLWQTWQYCFLPKA